LGEKGAQFLILGARSAASTGRDTARLGKTGGGKKNKKLRGKGEKRRDPHQSNGRIEGWTTLLTSKVEEQKREGAYTKTICR